MGVYPGTPVASVTRNAESDTVKLTLLFALLTSGLSQLGLTQLAEVTYVATAFLAWSRGRRSIATVMGQMRKEASERARSPQPLPQPKQTLPAFVGAGSP